MADRVKFSIKNVHYALLTRAADGTVSYGTPKAIPGAVALSMEPAGEMSKFFADGILYYMSANNNGYTGDLEVAYFPESFLIDVFGYTQGTTSKVLTENANTEPKEFALLCEEEGDSAGTKFVFYNCIATRPSRELKTKEETKTPATQKVSVTMAPLDDGSVVAMTGAETPEDVKTNWYKSVHQEAVA